MTEGATLDVELVRPRQRVSNLRSPTLSGVIYQTAADGRRHPYANSAVIYYSNPYGLLDAYTTTDADGRYEFCNLPLGAGYLQAGDCNDAFFDVLVDLRGDTTVDVDLAPLIKKCPGS